MLQSHHHSYTAGFTLIELLVVASLTVILLTTATAIFMSFLIGTHKAVHVQNIKNEGQFALSTIEFLLRNSISLEPNVQGQICERNMNSIKLLSLDGNATELTVLEHEGKAKIASSSAATTAYLTSGDIDLLPQTTDTDPATYFNDPTNIDSKIIFDCVESSDQSSRYVTINFTLRSGQPNLDDKRQVTWQKFVGGVTLRN